MTDDKAKNLGSFAGSLLQADERRTEPRFQAVGEIRMLIDGPQRLDIPGRILDVSQHGMRAEHMYSALATGMILEIQAGNDTYTARVVWNRIRNDGVETGFYLL